MEHQSQLQPQFLANDTSVKKYNLTLEKYCLDNEEDYQDFKKLMIGNIKFSTLQYSLQDLQLYDINNQEIMNSYFNRPENEAKMREVYKHCVQYNDKVNIAYYKIMEDGKHIGSAGFIVNELNQSNQIINCEAGIHLSQNHRTELGGEKKHYGSETLSLLKGIIQDNTHEITDDTMVTVKILQNNIRSQKFCEKNNIINKSEIEVCDGFIKTKYPMQKFIKNIDNFAKM